MWLCGSPLADSSQQTAAGSAAQNRHWWTTFERHQYRCYRTQHGSTPCNMEEAASEVRVTTGLMMDAVFWYYYNRRKRKPGAAKTQMASDSQTERMSTDFGMLVSAGAKEIG